MFKELYDSVKHDLLLSMGPQVREYDRHKDLLVLKPDGTVEKVEGVGARRLHLAYGLSTIGNFSEKYAETASVWYSRNAVVLFTDDNDRRNVVKLPLENSPQMADLVSMAAQKPALSQRELIQKLRTLYKGFFD